MAFILFVLICIGIYGYAVDFIKFLIKLLMDDARSKELMGSVKADWFKAD